MLATSPRLGRRRRPCAGRAPSLRAARAAPCGQSRSTRRGCAPLPAGRGSRRVLRLDEVQHELRLALQSRAAGEVRVRLSPRLRAAFTSPMSSTSASIARLRSCRCAPGSPRPARCSSVLRPLVAGLARAVDVQQRAAHVVVADLQRAPRLYGMWQSAQATPERAWMPWFHISNSGCCALSTGAPRVRVRPVLVRVLLGGLALSRRP